MYLVKPLIIFLSLLLLSVITYAQDYSQDNVEPWIKSSVEAVKLVEDIESKDFEIFSYDDYSVFRVTDDDLSTNISCHYHIDSDSSHCSILPDDFKIPEDYDLVLTLQGDEIFDFLSSIQISPEVMVGPVWPWVFGAIVTYYFAKKVINYWVYKTFKPRPHSHENFYLNKEELEVKIKSSHGLIKARLEGLKNLKDLNSQMAVTQERLSQILSLHVLSVTKKTVEDLHHENCPVCAAGKPHAHGLPKFSLTQGLGPTSSGSTSFSSLSDLGQARDVIQNFPAQQTTGTQNLNLYSATNEQELSPSEQTIKSGLILKYTRALLQDLKNELVIPIITLSKAIKQTVTSRENLSQMNAHAQTSFRVFLGESNAMAAMIIALNVVTIKVLGETIESVFVGPFHILCQISDVAAAATGIAMFSAYHCLRQPVRKRDLSLLTKSKFWSLLFKKIKNPKTSSLQSSSFIVNPQISFSSETLILELRTLKQELKKLLVYLRIEKRVSKKYTNDLALKIGRIHKQLEDQIFDFEMRSDTSNIEASVFVTQISPIIDEYLMIYTDLHDNAAKLTNQQLSDPSLNQNLNTISKLSCSGYLK